MRRLGPDWGLPYKHRGTGRCKSSICNGLFVLVRLRAFQFVSPPVASGHTTALTRQASGASTFFNTAVVSPRRQGAARPLPLRSRPLLGWLPLAKKSCCQSRDGAFWLIGFNLIQLPASVLRCQRRSRVQHLPADDPERQLGRSQTKGR